MKNLFDEFMEEIRRRQQAEAAARARPVGGSDDEARAPDGPEPEEPESDGPDRPGPEADAEPETESAEPETESAEPATDADAQEADERPEPEPLAGSRARRGGRGGGRPPRGRGPGGPNDGAGFGGRAATAGRRFGLGLVVVVILAFLALAGFGLDLWTDAIWYRSVGFDAVFWTRLGTQAVLFIGALAIALAVLLGNLWLAARFSPPPDETGRGSLRGFVDRLGEAARNADRGGAWTGQRPGGTDDESGGPFAQWGPFGQAGPRGRRPGGGRPIAIEAEDLPDLTPLAGWLIGGLAVLFALGIAGAASGNWETILLFQQRVPFAPTGPAVVDPVFGRDIGFFLFDLPFLRLGQSVLNGLVLGALLVSLGRYLVGALRGSLVFSTPVRVHLAVLAGLYLLSVAAGYQLDKFELVYSAQGVATGVSFTDENARFFALDVLTVIAALSAAFLVGGAFTRMIWPLGLAVGVWFVASFVLGNLYPEFIQRFTVKPDERAREERYIGNNIAMTRLAYGLDNWDPTDYSGEATLTQDAVDRERATFDNARLWDYRPLRDTLDQLQTVRQYYDFVDVDTDRYVLDGDLRQVMLSARELAPEKNPSASSWVNQRITFTHGVGLAFVPVNGALEGGQPRLLIRDIPPVTLDGAPPIDEFRIYFGERDSDWVIARARQPEFDYPLGSAAGGAGSTDAGAGRTTRWTGETGIRLENTLTRLLYAARFRDLNLLISDQVTADSQLLYHRSLGDRLQLIAPFLVFDKDPYLVVTDDRRLVWIQDAYTVSDRFPNAQYIDPASLPEGSRLAEVPLNYVRNSVKVVVDAYDGSMTFYAADVNDPILRAYEGVFPTLFTPLDRLPDGLRAHLRYPEELFNVETRMYARYHVRSAVAFYNNEDVWTVPASPAGEQSLPNEAYYVVMRMPGEADPEFLLLQPMVPAQRPNMIAWVAARNDGDAYGQVRVYRFPENTSVLGPNQIAAQISADPVISSQLTLWDQAGSTVIRGNLIVMPVQDALIYLQPVYLQAANARFPALQKVVLATSSRIVWGDTLADALRLLLAGTGPTPSPAPTTSPSPDATPTPAPTVGPGQTPLAGDVQSLVTYANAHFELAQQALRNGDFATYGAEIELVQQALRQLAILTGASPAP